MVAILSVLCVVALSILLTRVTSTALELTGLSRETARFQARSAFTGVGFTTSEAETIMIHPDRRRIVLLLMLLGSAGIVTATATLLLSFVGTGEPRVLLQRGGVLAAGLLVLAGLSRSRWVERQLSRVLEAALRRFTALEARHYASLLDLTDEFTVSKVDVSENSWLAGSALEELELDEEGILLLGIIRPDGSYVGSPRGRYTVRHGETLVLYGPADRLQEVQRRRRGAEGREQHEIAVERHRGDLRRQDAEQDRYAGTRT